MIKRLKCLFMGHEPAMTVRKLFYIESDLTEVTLRHEYLCVRCNRWIKL